MSLGNIDVGNVVGPLIALGIGMAILVTIAALTIMSDASAGLTSAVVMMAGFLGIIGLGVVVAVLKKLGLF